MLIQELEKRHLYWQMMFIKLLWIIKKNWILPLSITETLVMIILDLKL